VHTTDYRSYVLDDLDIKAQFPISLNKH